MNTITRDDGNGLRAALDEDRFTPPAVLAVVFVISMVLWGLSILAALAVLA